MTEISVASAVMNGFLIQVLSAFVHKRAQHTESGMEKIPDTMGDAVCDVRMT